MVQILSDHEYGTFFMRSKYINLDQCVNPEITEMRCPEIITQRTEISTIIVI